MSKSSYADLRESEFDVGSWDNRERDCDWDMASNATAGETGPGGHNIVPSGVVGAEYRLMKEALARETSPLRGMNTNNPSDPYHGRTMEPKTLREPARESFNLMVVGEAGLGKTTLLESFFQAFKDDEAAFALFERKETAREIETRRLLEEAQVRRNAAERELQAAVEKSEYATAHARQDEISMLNESMAELAVSLKELSLADERQRNELRALREATRALRLEMKRAADQSSFVVAGERQLEATLLQAECEAVQQQLKQMRRGSDAVAASRQAGAPDYDDEYDDELTKERRRALTSATVSVKAFDPFSISVGKHELQVTLVDTPGYGETLHTEESFEVITHYVDSLFERQLRAEGAWNARDSERLRLQDPLVHACLYFIAPHRLKGIDLAFMRRLHKKVNIVPIIAKSDTMTTKEKEEFKLQVRESLQREGIEAFSFDQAVLRSMEQQDKQEYKLPWAVIGSTDAHLDAGATVFLRKYPWGDALSSEPAHSDLPALRNLLMWSGQWHDLKMASRAKYEAWRATRPLSKRSRSALVAIVTASVAKAQRVVGGVHRAVNCARRAGHVACEAVGLSPRFASRALTVLVVALAATATPRAVRWATGTDVTASRQLAMARREVEQLIDDKVRLVHSYEKMLADLRSTLNAARSSGDHLDSEQKAWAVERYDLQRALRAATTRADVAEAKASAASEACSVQNLVEKSARATSAKVGGWAKDSAERVSGASAQLGKEVGEMFSSLRKETPGVFTGASSAASRFFSEFRAQDLTDNIKMHPAVG